MSQPIKVFRKTVVERKRFYLDYSCWLEEVEQLTNFQVTISPHIPETPITTTVGYTDATNKKLAMFVAGGKGNTDYTLQMVVHTDAGQIKRDDIGLRVLP
jgi:hypothetical protein